MCHALPHSAVGQSRSRLIETGRRDTLYDVRVLLRFADAIGMPREALLPLVLGDPGVLIEPGPGACDAGSADSSGPGDPGQG